MVKNLLAIQETWIRFWAGKIPGEGNSYLLQYSSLEIPWIEEPGRLQSMGSQRVRHD